VYAAQLASSARYTGVPAKKSTMNILLYSPDNGETRHFMPHLWMFLFNSLTPPGIKFFGSMEMRGLAGPTPRVHTRRLHER
jgi:hypothetical protein